MSRPPHVDTDADVEANADAGSDAGAPPTATAPPDSSSIDTPRRPFVLVWEVTQACDLACDHCRTDATPVRHPDELTTAEGKRLLDQARESGSGQLVALSGGDPLARLSLVDLVEYGTDMGLRMTLTPSGTSSLTSKMVVALFDADVKRMALSLDGATAASHDAFRGGDGSFDQTVAAVRVAREAGLPLQVNTTVCAQTVGELPAFCGLVTDFGAILRSVFFFIPVGYGRVLDPISPECTERVMEWLTKMSEDAPFGVKTTETPHYRRVAIQRQRNTSDAPPTSGIGRRLGITAGDGFAFVSHTGDLSLPGFLPMTAGNVRDGGFVERYRESDLFRSLRDRDALGGKCGVCELRHVYGGSRSRAYAHTGDPLASDPLCGYVPADYDGPIPGTRSTGD